MGSAAGVVVQDAEYYVLQAQNGAKWTAEDKTLDQKLAELREKYGQPPNIIHVMWDDTAYGDVGIPAIQKVRGLETPKSEQDGQRGHTVHTACTPRWVCTPSRAASATGRLAVRSGMYNIGMLNESHGLRGEEVTIAEVLSEAGYATAFYGKWHLGDIEESYPNNQGFDEALFTGYNQILSIRNRIGEGVNATMGLMEDMLPPDPYKLDDTFVTKGWVQVAEGTKGGPTRQWGDNSHDTYVKIDAEAQKRTLAFIRAQCQGRQALLRRQLADVDQLYPQPEEVYDRSEHAAGRVAVQHRSLHRQSHE